MMAVLSSISKFSSRHAHHRMAQLKLPCMTRGMNLDSAWCLWHTRLIRGLLVVQSSRWLLSACPRGWQCGPRPCDAGKCHLLWFLMAAVTTRPCASPKDEWFNGVMSWTQIRESEVAIVSFGNNGSPMSPVGISFGAVTARQRQVYGCRTLGTTRQHRHDAFLAGYGKKLGPPFHLPIFVFVLSRY